MLPATSFFIKKRWFGRTGETRAFRAIRYAVVRTSIAILCKTSKTVGSTLVFTTVFLFPWVILTTSLEGSVAWVDKVANAVVVAG